MRQFQMLPFPLFTVFCLQNLSAEDASLVAIFFLCFLFAIGHSGLGNWGWFIKVICLSTWHKEGWALILFMHQYLSLSSNKNNQYLCKVRKLSAGWLPSFFVWSKIPTKVKLWQRNSSKEVRACRKNFEQVLLLCFFRKRVSWRGQFINRKLDDCRAAKEKEGQDRSSHLRTRQSFWRCAVPIAPQVSLSILPAQHVFVICVYTEWQQILSN